MIAHEIQGFAIPHQRLVEVGLKLQGALEASRCVLEFTDREQRVAEIVERIRIIGLQQQRLAKTRDRVFDPPRFLQRIAEIVVGSGVVRHHVERLTVTPDGFVVTPQMRKRIATIIECFGVTRPQFECFAVMLKRLTIPAQSCQQYADHVVQHRIASMPRKQLQSCVQCLFDTALVIETDQPGEFDVGWHNYSTFSSLTLFFLPSSRTRKIALIIPASIVQRSPSRKVAVDPVLRLK